MTLCSIVLNVNIFKTPFWKCRQGVEGGRNYTTPQGNQGKETN